MLEKFDTERQRLNATWRQQRTDRTVLTWRTWGTWRRDEATSGWRGAAVFRQPGVCMLQPTLNRPGRAHPRSGKRRWCWTGMKVVIWRNGVYAAGAIILHLGARLLPPPYVHRAVVAGGAAPAELTGRTGLCTASRRSRSRRSSAGDGATTILAKPACAGRARCATCNGGGAQT